MGALRASLLVPCVVLLLVFVKSNHSIADAASLPVANSDKRAGAVRTCTARADALIPQHLQSPEVSAAFESYCSAITDIVTAVAQQVKRNSMMATGTDSAATRPASAGESLHGRLSGTKKGRKLIPGLGGVMYRIMMNVLFIGMQGACIFI